MWANLRITIEMDTLLLPMLTVMNLLVNISIVKGMAQANLLFLMEPLFEKAFGKTESLKWDR